MATIVIAGGSGFLGVSLAHHLAAGGADVVVLSRTAPRVRGPWRHVPWDARTLGEWRAHLDGAGALVNLVGRTVDCIKTPDHQDEILRSRVEATRVLGEAVRAVGKSRPRYGDISATGAMQWSENGWGGELGVIRGASLEHQADGEEDDATSLPLSKPHRLQARREDGVGATRCSSIISLAVVQGMQAGHEPARSSGSSARASRLRGERFWSW